MRAKFAYLKLSVCFFCLLSLNIFARDITFCGETIPVNDDFVANKLMNAIRKQIPNVNLPQLRQDANLNFPIVENMLRLTGLPEDLKYVAIVESGFRNVVSPVGAAGFWQLMPATARELGLTVNGFTDDRTDPPKASYAAFRLLARYYLSIRKAYGISSWILTAAAYNVGIGRITKSISQQGKNYFNMHLNAETAEYVYKIIAVKELWEHPELYMKNFNYNIFRTSSPAQSKKEIRENDEPITSDFNSVSVDINKKDGIHPDKIDTSNNVTNVINGEKKNKIILPQSTGETKNVTLIYAKIKGKYKKFEDGQLIDIELSEDLQLDNGYKRAGNIIRGTGWYIDDRIFIDLGQGRNIILYDKNSKQGVAMNSLKNNELLILKVFKSE